jgi:beta-glucoside operon transcriptional antiterminator
MLNDRLTVKKVVNNNIVVAVDFKGHEVIAMGKGLGFRGQKNSIIRKSEVSKTYFLVEGSNKGYILSLFQQIPYEIVELTQRIIDMASEKLQVSFNINLLVVLSDHIYFSVTQHKAGVDLPVPISEEVKRLYRDVYQIGKQALYMINDTLDVSLQPDEAASIAFHLITATENQSNQDARKIMQGVNGILKIVEQDIFPMEDDSIAYSRFIIHLKFFMRSVLFDQPKEAGIPAVELLSQLNTGNDKAQHCVEQISDYVHENYGYRLTDEDRLYLTIHVVRLLLEQAKK